MQDESGPAVDVTWRHFSLEQVNNQNGPDWKLWEQAEDCPSRGLRAFWASEAARRQGEAAFGRFHIALLKARHEERRDIASIEILRGVAESAGLDMAQFERDLSDRRLLTRLAEDHTFAVETLGVFGVPTLVFADQRAIFVRLSSPPPPEECGALFGELRHLAQVRPDVEEVKRPRRS